MDPEVFNPDLYPIYLVFVFVLGAAWGSFFGLCIARIPLGQSIVKPGSYCFSCGTPIRWSDNIPLVSYWLLHGRCRRCGTTFNSRHFWIELLSGLLFVSLFWSRCNPANGFTWTVLPAWTLTGLLIVATFTDIDHWIIPDRISIGGAAIGILFAFAPFAKDIHNIPYQAGPLGPNGFFFLNSSAWWIAPVNAAVGAGFGYGIMWGIGALGTLIFRKEAMGGGDLKLMAAIGAFLGYVNCLYVLFLSSLLGAVIGIGAIGIGKLRRIRAAQDAAVQSPSTDAESLAARALAYIYPDDNPNEEDARRQDRNTLLNLLTLPPAGRIVRHHLPFGPYLALAGFLVMLFHDKIASLIGAYTQLFGGGSL